MVSESLSFDIVPSSTPCGGPAGPGRVRVPNPSYKFESLQVGRGLRQVLDSKTPVELPRPEVKASPSMGFLSQHEPPRPDHRRPRGAQPKGGSSWTETRLRCDSRTESLLVAVAIGPKSPVLRSEVSGSGIRGEILVD